MAGVAPASAVLEGLPVTRWHWRLVVIVGLGTFFDLYEVFLGGVLAPVLATEFSLGTVGKALVIASGFAGMFVGANVLSVVADRMGRRQVFILNLLVYSLFSLAAAFSPNVETFLVLRFLAGIGLGAELVLVDTYLAEFIPARVRGRMTAWAYTIGFVGVPLAALLGGKLVVHQHLLGIDGWRWLLVFGGLGAVFVLAIRTMLPESPRWLESRGRDAEARAVVESVVAKVDPGARVPEASSAATSDSGDEARTVADVLRIAFRDYRKRTVMLVIFQVLQTVAYYGFGTLAPLVLVSKGFEVTQSLGYAALTFAGYPLGSLVSVPLVERFERKFLIIGSALGLAGVLAFPYFAVLTYGGPAAIFIAIVLSMVVHAMMYGPQAALIGEAFPTHLRYGGAGLGYQLASVFAGGPAPLLATWLLHETGTPYSISVYIVVSAVVTVACCLALRDRSRVDIDDAAVYSRV